MAQTRAGAGGRFRAQSVEQCGLVTPHAAPTSMRAASAVAKLGVSSSTTSTLMLAADRPRSKTFACGAALTMRSLLSTSLAANSWLARLVRTPHQRSGRVRSRLARPGALCALTPCSAPKDLTNHQKRALSRRGVRRPFAPRVRFDVRRMCATRFPADRCSPRRFFGACSPR
jgi:hypothetical protein